MKTEGEGRFRRRRRAPKTPPLLLLCAFLRATPASSFVRNATPRLLRGGPAAASPVAATRRDIFSSVPAAAAAAVAATPAASSIEGEPAAPAAPFAFSETSVRVSGVDVPVSVWRPAVPDGGAASVANPPTYPYAIDIGRIALKLRVGWLSWLPRFERPLPCGTAAAVRGPDDAAGGSPPRGFPPARPGDAVLFAHGFLGSAYDLAHAAEALAADGYVVVAPELPESLTASYVPAEGTGREEIIDAAMRMAAGTGGGKRWGIFGHSAGAGSALTHPAEFVLGRALLAGGAGRGRFAQYARGSAEPLFICSSNGDGCNAFMGLPDPDLRAVLDDGETEIFGDVRDAYASPSRRAPAKGAYVFAAGSSPVDPLPCHISFLWEAVDDAMVDLLLPLLPLAKALGLFLLDFDVYREQRDAAATAAVVVPAVRRFFLTNSAKP